MIRFLQRWRHLLGLALVLVVLYFFVTTLSRNWANIEPFDLRPNVQTLGAVLCFVVAVLISGALWGRVLNSLSAGAKIGVAEAVRVYCASWLLKYIPGQIGSYANKLAYGIQRGFSKRAITSSFVYENGLLLYASFLFSIPFVAWGRLSAGTFGLIYALWIILASLALWFTHRYGYARMMGWMLAKWSLTSRDAVVLSSKSLLHYSILFILPRLVNACGFVLIVRSVNLLVPGTELVMGAAYVLAGAVGLVALFVPSGLGVRESVLAYWLTMYMPVEQAMMLALLARFYSTIADMGVALLYVALGAIGHR